MSSKESPIESDEYKYVVGIDFGTTYSGAGYMFIKNADSKEVVDIRHWPKNDQYRYHKIPTIIRYHNQNPDLYKCGAEALNLRGKADKEYGKAIRLFKLHLDQDNEGVPEIPKGLTLLKIISDYLRDLHKNVIREMMSSLNDEKKKSTIRYCLTVPAIWDDRAKTTMREAAIQAGIVDKNDHPDRLLLIGEPEAAALYTEKMRGGIEIQSGETLMICDAGGGTIDLTTYKKTIEGETKSFKEITVSCGNTSGSTQLDNNFRKYVKRMISKEMNPSEEMIGYLENQFQARIKLNFGDERGSDDDEIECLELHPAMMGYKIDKGGFHLNDETLEISRKDLELEVFQPVIEEILTLIEYQLSQLEDDIKLDYIILVGGFGQSQYLNQKIKDKFQHLVKNIIAPTVGELAITRGAVFFGLNPYSITHRRMKISYGVGISSPFVEGVDRDDYKVIDKSKKSFCKHRFDVCVRKGQDVSLAESIRKTYYTYNSNTCHIKLYGFQGDAIPRYVSDDPDAANKRDVAFKVADFVLELPEKSKGGKKKTAFDLEIFFGHMEIKVVVDIPGQDEKLTFMAYYDNEGNQHLNRSRSLPLKYQEKLKGIRCLAVGDQKYSQII